MKKILPLQSLANLSSKLRKKGKKVILCHGVFDLLHVGHIKHLKKAKELGDTLIVTVTSDRYVNKGPNRPAFNQNLRCESIAALEPVDYVSVNDSPTAITPIKIVKPNIYCKGKDYKNQKDDITGEIVNEIKILKKNKGKIFFTEELTFSSSRLINRSTDFYTPRQKKILKKISKVSSFKNIKKNIDDFKKMKKDLQKKIKTNFIFKKNSPTIVKRRYVDHLTKSKVFGIYNINDEILNKKKRKNI